MASLHVAGEHHLRWNPSAPCHDGTSLPHRVAFVGFGGAFRRRDNLTIRRDSALLFMPVPTGCRGCPTPSAARVPAPAVPTHSAAIREVERRHLLRPLSIRRPLDEMRCIPSPPQHRPQLRRSPPRRRASISANPNRRAPTADGLHRCQRGGLVWRRKPAPVHAPSRAVRYERRLFVPPRQPQRPRSFRCHGRLCGPRVSLSDHGEGAVRCTGSPSDLPCHAASGRAGGGTRGTRILRP